MLPTPNNGSGLFGTGQAGQAPSTTLPAPNDGRSLFGTGQAGQVYSLRARRRRISAIASTSVSLQFQILFDGVKKSMNSSKDFP